jgi:hypothetical protein
MADRLVTHSFRSSEGDILAVGNPEEPWRQRQKDWAIADIVDGRHRYFVQGAGGTQRLIDVINDPDGLYLRARADSDTDNNLDNLPALDIHPWEIALDDAEILAVHAALVPHGHAGQVLFMGGSEHNPSQADEFLNTRIYDVFDNRLININSPEADVFCCEHAFLPDGRLLIAGGTDSWIHTEHAHEDAHGQPRTHWSGTRACAIYDLDGTWTSSAPLLPEPGHPTRGGGRWYPTLLTLGDGDVLAVGGHPLVSDTEPDDNDSRHGAWLPERYNLATDTWTYQLGHWLYVQWSNVGPTDPETLEEGEVLVELPEGQERGTTNSYLYYPRLFLLPDGRVFMASTNEGVCGWYDTNTGLVDDMTIEPPDHGSDFRETNHTAVLLPLLPGDDYQAHVLFFGMQGPRRITLDTSAGAAPEWQVTTERDWPGAPPLRRHGVATLLPTGDVIFTGGIDNDEVSSLPDTDATLAAEIYHPGVNWEENQIDFAEEAWTTTPEASVPRNYHSVALLLPNGRVLTAGSNINGGQGGDAAKEFRVEVYTPEYFYDLTRPEITAAPSSLSYGESFSIETTRANQIQRVALTRCGSVTHAWDGDQRYVGLEFTSNETSLNVTSPPHGNIAPPGPYMLWVIDNDNRPCRLAPFVVLA